METGEKAYPCELCSYVGPTPYNYTRHKHINHSPWKDLELDMHEPGYKILVCPYGGCDFEDRTVRRMIIHMLDVDDDGLDLCPNAPEFREIKAQYDALVPQDPRTEALYIYIYNEHKPAIR
ncbi:hypothetical protein CPB83DRAFT_576722 [Crepidotus variabilis]|uniref:C2H2-type domain-containing protein n=1 Tax=Crepidotus variabilis TaxID=179855 RepID=A0A9P6E989_9AGAR|nr:hypothetical protein CPB83DRAFT_576722 [Crepidotus variabilis]